MFDDLMKNKEYGKAGKLFANEYYKNGKMGLTRKKLIYILSENFISKNINKKCDYCKSIEKATPASPRKKYKYCPMCGRKRK